MTPSKRRKDPLPKFLVQGVVCVLILSTVCSQWLSFKNSRNPKSNLWFPNMPGPKTLQQRSSIGSSIRGLGPINSDISNDGSNSGATSSSNNNNNFHESNRHGVSQSQRSTRPIGYRSVPHHHVGQPTYQTVHGGVINRHESVNGPPRNSGYASSSRNQHQQHAVSGQNQRQLQQQGQASFSHRSGQPHPQQSWNNNKQATNPAPTVISSNHMSINLNQPGKNKQQLPQNTRSSSGSGYTSSRRLLEVGRVGHVESSSAPTRRPITQIAGALQDSWPNSNTHHHLSPIMKNQRPNLPNNRNNYYEPNGSDDNGASGWGTSVRVSDQAIEIKVTPKPGSAEQKESPVDRKLSVGGREKLVSNTLNTLAKLSPKKPIYVYMRIEGIAAIQAGAEAGDVIKKLAGGSKLPFYNGTKSLPKENIPQVFLAPEDMPPPGNYGKVPIPNLRTKETTTQKPTFTKILLPGGTKMTSGLASTPKTTTTSTTMLPPLPLPQLPLFDFVQTTAQAPLHSSFLFPNGTGLPNDQPLSLEQRIQILQMFQNQAMMQQQHPLPSHPPQIQPTYQPQSHSTYQPFPPFQARPQFPQPQNQQTYQVQSQPTYQPYGQLQPLPQPPHPSSPPERPYQQQTQPPTPEPTPLHTDFLRGVLPQGAILESITPLGGDLQGNLNQFSQHAIQDPSNSIVPTGSQTSGDTNLQGMLGSMIDSTVSKTVSDMLPNFQMHHQPERVGHAQSREQVQQPYNFHPSPTPFAPQLQHQQHFITNPGQAQAPMINNRQQVVWMNNGQRPRAPPGPPTHNRNTLKGALSFLGIQSTPRSNNVTPTGPTQRPFQFQPNPSSPSPPIFNSPTRAPFLQYPRPTHVPLAARREDVGSSGSIEHLPPGPNKQTLIVQTPDASKPNGQKSTYVISNGDGNLPDLNKIMKVLTELNGDQSSGNPNGPPSPQITQTRQPQPSFHPTAGPFLQSPTRRPINFPFNPTGQPQPQVMIRHPSGTPTPGPIIFSTGRPNGSPLHQIVSSTFSPNGGPTTPRPSFVSSTAGPFMMGIGPSPSSSPVQIIKALSHPDFLQLPQPSARPVSPSQFKPTQTQRPLLSNQPQLILANSNGVQAVQPNADIMKSIMNAIPGVMTNANINRLQHPTPTPPKPASVQLASELPIGVDGIPPGSARNVIEVDPNLSPEEMQKAIMESIMKHQQETNGGLSNGPIVINADPSMASALGNSPHFKNVQPSGASPSATPDKSSFTVEPAVNPSRPSKPSSMEIGSSSSVEKQRESINQVNTFRKEHHHSKEISGEKSTRKQSKSGESMEPIRQRPEPSSEEKVIEKVITEEKIVWNPGSKEGEMIPSRIKTEERIRVSPNRGSSKSVEKKSEEERSGVTAERFSTETTGRKTFGASLVKNKGNAETDDESSSADKSEDNKSSTSASLDSSNFAGLLRSKLKFEKMKEKLYHKKIVPDSAEVENPFSRYLHPSAVVPTDASTSSLPASESTQQPSTSSSTSISPPELTVSAHSIMLNSSNPTTLDNGRFKIRPGDISSNNKVVENMNQGPVYGISPTGQPMLLQPTQPTFMVSPSPSAFPTIGPSGFSPTGAPSFSSSGPPAFSPSVPSVFSPSPSLASFLANPTGNPTPASYIGPSPSSYPFIQQMTPSSSNKTSTISLGKNEERLIFIPADSPSGSSGSTNQGPTISTKNGQNQTVLFTTMNNLPDLMSQLSGTKTEVRMIDDLKSFQATLAKVQATQASSTLSPSSGPPTQPTPADRRMDVDDKPITWRPNGSIPIPTLESLRQRFPSGLGANVLHAVSAGFAANDPNKPRWGQNGQQPQLIYTMPNGIPVAINPMGGYQPILMQGTKEPMLAYYGYNWNNANNAASVPEVSTFKPSESGSELESKYTSRFRGNPPSTFSEVTTENSILSKIQKKITRDPIDPVSEEYEEMSKESIKNNKSGKSNHKTQSDDSEEPPKHSRRRRPGAPKEDSSDDPSQEAPTKNSKNRVQSVTPNILSKRIDDADITEEDIGKKVQVQKEIFVHSGEKSDDEVTHTSKLPILLAPSIISRKSVVSKTGSSFSDTRKISPIPTAAASVAETTHSTTKQISSAVTKLLATMPPTKSTTQKEKSEDEDLRETQAELKSLLKKLQQKLNSRDEVYELGDGFYDYYDDLQQVPSTKATTTTTKGTKRPVKSSKKAKNKKNSTKSKSKSKDKKKSNKKSKDSKSKTKHKTTTTTTTTAMTTKPPVISPSFTTVIDIITPSPPPIMNHHRHPVSSIETFTSPSTIATTANAQPYQASSEIPSQKHQADSEPLIEPRPKAEAPSTESPTDSSNTSNIAFVYPQTSNKDLAASKIHHRRRPLWVRRKSGGGGSGSVEMGSLEPLAQPTSHGKVIRLVRRKRPGMRRRPVFVQQSIEVDQSSDQVPTESPTTTTSSTTTMPVDILFESSNDLSKRVGYPDSVEKSQPATPRAQGKRKLKLIRLKGQRAQWRLKMNEEQDQESSPQAEKLVSLPQNLEQQLPQASPLPVAPAASQSQIIQAERQSRQEPPSSIEAKVCIMGKCEMISK